MVDNNLILRCIREEPKAQSEMYRALYSLMMSICTRYERNKQDAVARMNEGFLKVLTNLEKRRPDVPFDLWVRRIMINTVIDDHRRNKTRVASQVLTESFENADYEEVNSYLHEMLSEEIETMIKRLPEMSARVFNLFAIDGYSHLEIAEMLGISDGTSRWHVSQARSLLQKFIAEASRETMIQTR